MSDPSFNNIDVLANFVGADNATSYTSDIGLDFNFFGNAKLDDAVPLFGNTVVQLDGTGDYLTWGAQADSQFLHDNSTDYTLELWVKPNNLGAGGDRFILATRALSGAGIQLVWDSNYKVRYKIYDGDSFMTQLTSGNQISTADYQYIKIAYSKTLGSVTMYMAGVQEASSSTPTPDAGLDTNLAMTLGRRPDGAFSEANVRIGPIRITKGQALADTDVPTDIFPTSLTFTGRIAIPGPLQAPKLQAAVDFTDLITDPSSYYIMVLSGDPEVVVPISSWQATLQLDRSNYTHCVVPACGPYVDDITDRQGVEDFLIYKVTRINGYLARTLMARAPVERTSFSRGPTNYTCVIEGYTDASQAPPEPSTIELQGVRTVSDSTTGQTRVRCTIDTMLAPGDTASVDGTEFVASYINYYTTSIGDAYMDVGER